MKTATHAVVELVGYSLFSSEVSLQSCNWQEVYQEAYKHGVLPLVYDALARLREKNIIEIDSESLSIFKNAALMIILSNYKKTEEQNSLLREIDNKGIKVSVLKGTSLAMNYPNPSYRSLGDLDIFVSPDDIKAVSEIIESLGYVYERTNTQYHSSFRKNGFEIEMHNSPAGMPVGKTLQKMLFLKRLNDNALKYEAKGTKFFYPCVRDNGIIQLLHILHHTATKGMNLRLLCDWIMFVDSNISDEVWEKELKSTYEDIGLARMAALVTKMCQIYLKYDNPNVNWYKFVSDDECKPFWEYITVPPIRVSTNKVGTEFKLREDEWEYKSIGGSIFFVFVIIRNIKRIITGKRSISEFFAIYKDKKQIQDRFVKFCFFNKKTARDFAM